jgi:DNA primase
VAEGRSLELRVAALPPGLDPADLVRQEGVEAMQARIARSAPFVSFYVERILDKTAGSDAEARGRAFMEEIGPILIEFASDPAKAPLRAELEQHAASRLAISTSVVESMLQSVVAKRPAASPPRQQPSAPPEAQRTYGGGALDELIARRGAAERTFLALCAAFPSDGAALLGQANLDEHFTSEALRRAALHLRVHLTSPLDDLPEHDGELRTVISEVAARAAHNDAVTAGNLKHAWLSLELARLDRAIDRARVSAIAEGAPSVSVLSAEREQVRMQLRSLSGRLQSA